MNARAIRDTKVFTVGFSCQRRLLKGGELEEGLGRWKEILRPRRLRLKKDQGS